MIFLRWLAVGCIDHELGKKQFETECVYLEAESNPDNLYKNYTYAYVY